MPQQIINLGATGSGAGGDSARTAFEKAIANFAELYPAALPGTAAQKQAARDMFGLGTAATRAVQTGPTDTTAGAVATTEGARFAVLANFGNYYSSSAGKNIDTLVGGESGLFSNSNPGTFPPGFGSFVYIETQQTYTNSAKTQQAWDYASTSAPAGRQAFRVCSNGGEWSPWRVCYHSGNLVGTVSQASGVPTGAIIERGSNANGEYVRFADGTQICWLSSAELGFRVANVSAGATGTVIWGYPAAFASTPDVTANWGSNDGSIRVNGQPQRKSSRTSTQCPINWQALLSVAGAASQLDAVAIGRWYN